MDPRKVTCALTNTLTLYPVSLQLEDGTAAFDDHVVFDRVQLQRHLETTTTDGQVLILGKSLTGRLTLIDRPEFASEFITAQRAAQTNTQAPAQAPQQHPPFGQHPQGTHGFAQFPGFNPFTPPQPQGSQPSDLTPDNILRVSDLEKFAQNLERKFAKAPAAPPSMDAIIKETYQSSGRHPTLRDLVPGVQIKVIEAMPTMSAEAQKLLQKDVIKFVKNPTTYLRNSHDSTVRSLARTFRRSSSDSSSSRSSSDSSRSRSRSHRRGKKDKKKKATKEEKKADTKAQPEKPKWDPTKQICRRCGVMGHIAPQCPAAAPAGTAGATAGHGGTAAASATDQQLRELINELKAARP